MPTNYARGRSNEYMCMREMEKRGYKTMRSPQSGGGWDVMAWNESEVHFIQVKGYVEKVGSFKKDFVKLMDVPPTPHCIKSFWVRKLGQRGWESITVLWSNLPCQTNITPGDNSLSWLNWAAPGQIRPSEPSSSSLD